VIASEELSDDATATSGATVARSGLADLGRTLQEGTIEHNVVIGHREHHTVVFECLNDQAQGPLAGLVVRFDHGAAHERTLPAFIITRIKLGFGLGFSPGDQNKTFGIAGRNYIGRDSFEGLGDEGRRIQPIGRKLLANEYLENDFSGGLTRALPSTDPDRVHVGEAGECFRSAASNIEKFLIGMSHKPALSRLRRHHSAATQVFLETVCTPYEGNIWPTFRGRPLRARTILGLDSIQTRCLRVLSLRGSEAGPEAESSTDGGRDCFGPCGASQ